MLTKGHIVSIGVGALGMAAGLAAVIAKAAPCLEQAMPQWSSAFAAAATFAAAAGPVFALLTPKVQP